MIYDIYLASSKKPVWSYTRYTTLRRRLRALADNTTISELHVRLEDGETLTVQFTRNGTCTGWRCEQGILTPNGTRILEDLIHTKPPSLYS